MHTYYQNRQKVAILKCQNQDVSSVEISMCQCAFIDILVLYLGYHTSILIINDKLLLIQTEINVANL